MSSKEKAASKNSLDTKTASKSTRDHLIDAGLDLMRKHGYGATGLQEILNAAGVPKGSFYHHFRSKEEFTGAVVERYYTLAMEHAQKVLGNAHQAPLRRLRRYFEELIQVAGQSSPIRGCLLGSLSLEVAEASPLLQSCLTLSFTQWQAVVASVLREAMERGDLPKTTKPDSLAGFVLNSWEGSLLRSQADRSDAPLKDFLRFVFEALLA
ncbi:TetR/AcrR family transcriptional regulator [Terriglobus roseus]|uniref:Transcriptional regulator, TetR family n=1 Tax=Terriglobus roseus TaxID=392734 RepID=A0A1H4JVQ4_9BACT|nr:TetR/AcrR family transcriptional regulator [Terriglobus roseus]SEB49742.1 transcriptional regulator, TetR family [Terriglobus roseus]